MRRASASGGNQKPDPPDCMPPRRRLRRLRATNLLVFAVMLLPHADVGRAESATLSIEFQGQKRHFSTAELLANPATRTLEIPDDPAYGHRMLRPFRSSNSCMDWGTTPQIPSKLAPPMVSFLSFPGAWSSGR